MVIVNIARYEQPKLHHHQNSRITSTVHLSKTFLLFVCRGNTNGFVRVIRVVIISTVFLVKFSLQPLKLFVLTLSDIHNIAVCVLIYTQYYWNIYDNLYNDWFHKFKTEWYILAIWIGTNDQRFVNTNPRPTIDFSSNMVLVLDLGISKPFTEVGHIPTGNNTEPSLQTVIRIRLDEHCYTF